jgi:aminoglycoside phosphotransferase (APT) family kinase protein
MKYSERLGEITIEQFQKALDNFNLGEFVKAEPISQGLFGQNVYITSDKGQFVLRGKPHYDWQFPNEKLMAELLHEKTQVPVPYPYLLEKSKDIFGWEFVIMPRLRGKNLSDDLSEGWLLEEDRVEIAEAQGTTLKEAQRLTYEYCGKYDLETSSIKAYSPDWFTEFSNQIFVRLEKASQHNDKTPPEDMDWAEGLIEEAKRFIDDFTPCFYMQDYKPGNMVVDKVAGKWQVTGLFDLMEASFGHPEADLSRMFAFYIEKRRENLAYAFINSYLEDNIDLNSFIKRFPLFMLHDRSIKWEWVQRTDNAWWDTSWTFREWVSNFLGLDPIKLNEK